MIKGDRDLKCSRRGVTKVADCFPLSFFPLPADTVHDTSVHPKFCWAVAMMIRHSTIKQRQETSLKPGVKSIRSILQIHESQSPDSQTCPSTLDCTHTPPRKWIVYSNAFLYPPTAETRVENRIGETFNLKWGHSAGSS